MPATFSIVPIAEEHIAGFHAAVDGVSRELLYLAFLEAPQIETTREFVRANITASTPQLVALADGKVAGWCDVSPKERPAYAHTGVLGMGVIAPYRGRGIGRALMEATLKAARAKGMTRIELTVRVDNERAKKLYESFGFAVEGTCRRHVRIKGEYVDSYSMALLF